MPIGNDAQLTIKGDDSNPNVLDSDRDGDDKEEAKQADNQMKGKKSDPTTDIYKKVIKFLMVRPCGNRRECCATSVLAFSVLLAVCAILLFIASQMFANTELVDAFKPLRDNKETASRGLIVVAAVIFVTGLFGIGAFKIKNKVFIMIFGFLLGGIIVISGGFIAIFGGMANMDAASLH